MAGRPDLVATLAQDMLLLVCLENRQVSSLGVWAAPASAALGQHADAELGPARPAMPRAAAPASLSDQETRLVSAGGPPLPW